MMIWLFNLFINWTFKKTQYYQYSEFKILKAYNCLLFKMIALLIHCIFADHKYFYEDSYSKYFLITHIQLSLLLHNLC